MALGFEGAELFSWDSRKSSERSFRDETREEMRHRSPQRLRSVR